MSLVDIVHNYIKQPYPLWEYDVNEVLVQQKWIDLRKHSISDLNDYSTARCIHNYTVPLGIRFPISCNLENETIYLETPSLDYLQHFYDKHGLYPYSEYEIETNAVLSKLKSAIAVFDLVKPAYTCIAKLVRSIQVLKQDDVEIDISYSHPKIPFSIFVSVCQDSSPLSSLRVAESILHEAMHLKLTLLENVVQLVKPNTGNLFFSPWRDEKRPAQGVLHGLFVFRAILDFFGELGNNPNSEIMTNHLNNRNEQIAHEINLLKDFHSCPDLTKDGATLTKNLLPLN